MTYAVNLSADFLSRSGRLVADFLHRLPLEPSVVFLLCDEFDPTGPMVRLLVRMHSSDEKTALFLHHRDIDSVFVLEHQRTQFGFLDKLTSHEPR